jgi:NAD-dependent SIR2 family protein deacetylase
LLDPGHLRRIEAFFRGGGETLLLVIGTSGEVSGGYGFTQLARYFGARIVEINPDASLLSRDVDLALREPAGALLGRVWPLVSGRPAGA